MIYGGETSMNSAHRWSRRQWLSAAAAATGAAAVPPGRALAGMGSAAGRAVAGAREAVDAKLKPFPLSGVRLRPGIFLDYLESNQGFLDSLPNDRLLHTFRLTAGIPTSADPLVGWELCGRPCAFGVRAAACCYGRRCHQTKGKRTSGGAGEMPAID